MPPNGAQEAAEPPFAFPVAQNTGDIISANLLAMGEIVEFAPFETANNRNEPVGSRTRREWRIKQETGELRGVSIRERNKDRKPVGWIDKKSPGWEAILASYETWRRTARYPVGTLEQPTNLDGGQPTGKDTRAGVT